MKLATRWLVGGVLTAVMIAAYFGFIAIVAFAKQLAGELIGGGVSVGIVLGAAVIVIAPVLTAIYVWWANKYYDAAVAAHRAADSAKEPPA